MGTEERAACKWQLRRGERGAWRGSGVCFVRETRVEDPCEDFTPRLGGAIFVLTVCRELEDRRDRNFPFFYVSFSF